MTVIPINGKNERMGGLFKTPKHLLLYKGRPAIESTVEYMRQFGKVVILANFSRYYDYLEKLFPGEVFPVSDTDNVVETIMQGASHIRSCKHGLYIVDCDIVPEKLNKPIGNTVYLFRNEDRINHYSNYKVVDGMVIKCNEKGNLFDYAGAGVYHFSMIENFFDWRGHRESICAVMQEMIHTGKRELHGDTTSEIFRLGTLPDITGGFTGNKIRITKSGATVQNELAWYEAYEDKTDLPEITDPIGDQFSMEFLQPSEQINVYKVHALVNKYRTYRPLNLLDFSNYIHRIENHLQRNPIYNGGLLLENLKKIYPLDPTFCHGDLSVQNIIPTSRGHKLIDPLYSSDKFGSYIVDYAKFLFSLKFYKNDLPNYDLFRSLVHLSFDINILVASECVRVATYNRNFNFVSENLIAEI